MPSPTLDRKLHSFKPPRTPIYQIDNMASPSETEFYQILAAGEDHPRFEAAQHVKEEFDTALMQQYYAVRLSWALGRVYLEENRTPENERQPVKALLPAIPQHALIVRNRTLRKVRLRFCVTVGMD
jgi:hypothetical protein